MVRLIQLLYCLSSAHYLVNAWMFHHNNNNIVPNIRHHHHTTQSPPIFSQCQQQSFRYVASTTTTTSTTTSATITSTQLFAAKRKNRNQQSRQDEEDLNRWYESVNADASPDDIFWEEMERQRLLSQVRGDGSGGSGGGGGDGSSGSSSSGSSSAEQPASSSSSSSLLADSNWAETIGQSSPTTTSPGSPYNGSSSSSSSSSKSDSTATSSLEQRNAALRRNLLLDMSSNPTQAAASAAVMSNMNNPNPMISGSGSGSGNGSHRKNVEATLSEYAAYMVSDNWLDDELAAYMMQDSVDSSSTVPSLDEQLEEWELEEDEEEDEDDDSNAWMQSDEPWDHWGEQQQQKHQPRASEQQEEEEEQNKIEPKNMPSGEYVLEDDDEEDEQSKFEREQEEQAYQERLSQIKISSRRLERARDNPKAKAFFGRGPDEREGYDRLWVSAIDNVCFNNLVGALRNYGVQFADNFGDFKDGCMEDGFFSIEDVASYKARQVFQVTGLPCIASRTMFEIEPIPDLQQTTGSVGRSPLVSPRVESGYRFNDIGLHVDYICEALRQVSEPSRVTRFKTCLCYYDGEMEVFDYGVCDVDLVFANSIRTFIPVAQAINEMVKTLQLTFGLEYQSWLKSRVEESIAGLGSASLRLRDRVLKEARVLPNDIVDVSAFMDSNIDVNLMDECAKELSQMFVSQKPNKILTVATTGLVIALPMAKYLQVPVVYARKERSVVMADTYKATYSSKTVGKNRELLVSTDHLSEDDRVLVVDDFLSAGSSQEALLRIVLEAGATAVGIGVLLEKVYDSGRQALSGFDVPVHSLCRIASVKEGAIQLVEEEGFDGM